ncbi:MAG: winged helix-turn-helix domain-containing protein [Candidatus Hodarchaeales archaeon]
MTEKISQIEDVATPLQDMYAALGHAIRFDIIHYLGAFHRPVHYSELVEWLQIKPGSFYFHMKKLKGYVEQDSEKRFLLTSMGEVALDVMRSGKNIHSKYHEIPKQTGNQDQKSLPNRFSIKFFGEYVRKAAFDRNFNYFVSVVIIVQVLILDLANLGMIPFFLDGGLYFGLMGCLVELIFSIVIIWLLIETIMRFFSPIRGFSLELLSGIPLALVPLFIYPLLIVFTERIPLLSFLAEFLANTQVSIVSLFILQIITAVFLVQLLQVIKAVDFERALIPVFLVLYGFSILSFFVSSFL